MKFQDHIISLAAEKLWSPGELLLGELFKFRFIVGACFCSFIIQELLCASPNCGPFPST
jgi:hypothetical protein